VASRAAGAYVNDKGSATSLATTAIYSRFDARSGENPRRASGCKPARVRAMPSSGL